MQGITRVLLLLKSTMKKDGIDKRFVLVLLYVSFSVRALSIPIKNVLPFLGIPTMYRSYYLKEHSAALGHEDADDWRTELVHQTLKELGVKKSENITVNKLSHAASQELHAHGYCTVSGIWLYHTPGM